MITFNITSSFLFKIIFLIVLIILTIYLLYLEYNLIEAENRDINNSSDSYMESSTPSGRKTLRDIVILYIPSLLAYMAYFKGESTDINIEKLKEEIKRKDDKTGMLAPKEKELSREINKLEPDLDKLVEKINKSSIFSIDFDKFISSLSREELLAFSGLLLNQLVLSYVVTIILILYGDYLIKRFDLENKYPKIAKFIQLRRKLQSYYLKLCFLWIFIGILPQIFVYLYILSDKLSELFF